MRYVPGHFVVVAVVSVTGFCSFLLYHSEMVHMRRDCVGLGQNYSSGMVSGYHALSLFEQVGH